jgi:hypothetical protein
MSSNVIARFCWASAVIRKSDSEIAIKVTIRFIIITSFKRIKNDVSRYACDRKPENQD